MEKVQVIILAAGVGKRMKNPNLPKALVLLRGKPLIEHLVEKVKAAAVCEKIAVVIGRQVEMVKTVLGTDYIYAYQSEPLGTGHAVASARSQLEGKADNVMVLYGDMPFISVKTIKEIAATHLKEDKVLTMATVVVDDFQDWRECFYSFGRVIRDPENKIIGIVEKKDATAEVLAIREVNPAYFCFKADWLWSRLAEIKNNNSQGEYYLTDLVDAAFIEDQPIANVKINPKEALGINTPEQLELAEKLL